MNEESNGICTDEIEIEEEYHGAEMSIDEELLLDTLGASGWEGVF